MRRNRTSRPGFTLVELLVVIGIIVILIALLAPAARGAWQGVQRVSCQSNLRQIGMAMEMYTQQYKFFPNAWINVGDGRVAQCWPVRLRAFLGGGEKVFHCPAQDPRSIWTRNAPRSVAFAGPVHAHFGYVPGERLIIGDDLVTTGTQNGMYFDYGINSLGTVGTWPPRRGVGGNTYDRLGNLLIRDVRRRDEVISPSRFIVIADTVADGAGDGQVFPWNLAAATGHDNSPASVHRGGANALFADGHVEWFLKSDLVIQWPPVRSESAKQRRWNIDDLPA
jgi:prepilin-type processing-associated H-X9-DG protein/prepilin-type N-terminal cleavage/methylation domain-containing protein